MIFFVAVAAVTAMGQVRTGFGTALEAWESASWPTTTAHIVSSKIERSASTTRKSGAYSYQPVIIYAYSVNGQAFTGTEITPGRMWGSASSAAAVQAFSAGSHPLVAYSPTHPQQALLVPGLHLYNCGGLSLGMLFSTMALLFGLIFYWVPRQGNKAVDGSVTFTKGGPAARTLPWLLALIFVEFFTTIWLSWM